MASRLTASGPAGAEEARLVPAVSPLGRFYLERRADAVAVEPAVERRLEEAFARGPAPGVLRLGAAEVATPLPPTFGFFRDLGARFVAAVCRVPDVEERRDHLDVPCPHEEVATLAAAVPPITGAEYVTS